MRCKSGQRAVIARCFVFLLASVVIGSSCTPRQQQQTTIRIWQTANSGLKISDTGEWVIQTHDQVFDRPNPPLEPTGRFNGG